MKLLSRNICIRMNNTKQVVDFLLEQDADIVALQECTRDLDHQVYPQYRSYSAIITALSELYPYSFFGPQWVARQITKDGEPHHDFGGYIEQGNLLLSKYPITSAKNHHVHKQYQLETDHSYRWADDHPRCVAQQTVKVWEKYITIYNLHGWYTSDKQWNAQTEQEHKQLMNLIDDEISTMVVWDFNLLPNVSSILQLDERLSNITKAYNIPRTRPGDIESHITTSNIVDYIYTSDDINVSDFQVVENGISDHYPSIVTFEL